MTLDKNKAYRFRGDSERWVVGSDSLGMLRLCCSAPGSMTFSCAEHLHERGILLEYPELPGEDWEFCEAELDANHWCDRQLKWASSIDSSCSGCSGIYCRKKKPVYRSGKVVNGKPVNETIPLNTVVYWTTDPEKGKELLS